MSVSRSATARADARSTSGGKAVGKTRETEREPLPKVLLVSTLGEVGDSHTLLFIDALLRLPVQVLSIRTGELPQRYAARGVTHFPLPQVTRFFWTNKGRSLRGSLSAAWQRVSRSVRLWRRIVQLQPAVVIATEPDSWLVAVLAARTTGSRVIEDLREVYEARVGALPRTIQGVARTLLRQLEWWMSSRTDEVIHVSPERQQRFAHLATPGHVVTYYPDLRDERWKVAPSSAPIDAFVLVHAGSLRHLYGGDVLLRAVARAREAVPTLVLRVLGGRAGEFEEEVLLDELLRMGAVQFLPPVPPEEVPALLRGAHVGVNLVLPVDDLHYLAQPRKLYEYFAAGLPVIVSDVPTLRRVVRQHDCGLVLDAYDVAGFADAIVCLARDQQLRERMGLNARRATELEFNWETQERLYHTIVSDALQRWTSHRKTGSAARV
jgi:glycosyltransferase involved in cell wall biosynthesis